RVLGAAARRRGQFRRALLLPIDNSAQIVFGAVVLRAAGMRPQADTRTNFNYLSNVSPASKLVPNNGLRARHAAISFFEKKLRKKLSTNSFFTHSKAV
ncbi:MAG: hypothetical protein IIY78_09615, partial [Clostridia bacterium]|nr:hypothetical protein [Clostridia bacterium]